MRLPPELLHSQGFVVTSVQELIDAIGTMCSDLERSEIERLWALGLPPVTSIEALSVMLGFNRGFTWSLVKHSSKYYRVFPITTGKKERIIEAPRVSLKIIQKWLSYHFEKCANLSTISHGFVGGRSHITAAHTHLGAHWVASFDIRDFFRTTPEEKIRSSLKALGYHSAASLDILAGLTCIFNRLSQGSPVSPILSNICLNEVDVELNKVAERYGSKVTRYADDIVFSGVDTPPVNLLHEVTMIFEQTPWKLSDEKTEISILPRRLKVHGLLVDGNKLRLTKGYRNRLRAYKYLINSGKVIKDDIDMMIGHINYGEYVDRIQSS